MKNEILEIGLNYNAVFSNGFDADQVDIPAVRTALLQAFSSHSLKGRSLAIYGASTSGLVAMKALEGCKVGFFIDMAPAKRSFAGLPVFPPAATTWPDVLLLAVSPANHLSALKALAKHLAPHTVIVILWQSEFFDPQVWMQTRNPAADAREPVQGHQPQRQRTGDNRGAIVFEGNRVLRCILDQDRDFYEELLADTTRMDGLHVAGLVATSRTDQPGCVLEHELQLNLAYTCWSMTQFRDAALFFLDFWSYLFSNGYSLQDSNPENIMFRGTTPVFVDFCSIGPWEAATVSPVFLEHYFSSWIYPLALLHSKQLTFFYELFDEKLTLEQVEPMLIPAVLEEVRRLRTAGQAHFSDKDIPGFIATMRDWVNGVQIVHSSLGWNTEAYQEQELGAPEPQSPKEKAMDGLYDRYQPETLLDLGCNKGRFSYLAALRNVRTYAFDTAESLIDKLYLFAKATGLPIQAHVVDGARLEPFSDPEIRFDMVAYLAVIHHLIFTFGKTVQEVVAQADGLCERVAILEYVSSDPAETFVYTNYDPELYPDYNVPGITRELLKYFDAVEAIDISVSRTLLVASREGRPDTRKVHER